MVCVCGEKGLCDVLGVSSRDETGWTYWADVWRGWVVETVL